MNKPDLERDLLGTDWILTKVRDNPVYAQKLYSALCNQRFQKIEVMPILLDQEWSCSWRYAGGIIAEMLGQGDYIDWYCSGNEGLIDPEIAVDLRELGWTVLKDE
jgi:hypothetical protein